MQIDTTNPAARLLEVLERMLRVEPNKGYSCKQAWAMALDIPEKDGVQLAQGIAEVFSLLQRTKQELLACEGINQELYLASFPAIEAILDLNNMPGAWDSYQRQLSQPHVLLGLRFCESHLRTKSDETVIDSTTLNNLVADVSDAIGSISKDTSLPPELRELLLEHLQSIQAAIALYRVRGGESIKHSVERAIGGLMAHRRILKGQEQSRGLVRFLGVIEKTTSALENVTVFARKGFALASVVKDGVKLLN